MTEKIGGSVSIEKIVGRIVRMIKFDSTVYKEIEEDTGANTEAIVVVVVATFLAALGSAVTSGSFFGMFFSRWIGGIVGWLVWTVVTTFIGTRFFKGETNYYEMGRCLGYATAPLAIGILGAIPCLGIFAGLISLILLLVVGFFAVREALDLPTERTLLVLVIGWVIVFLVNVVFFAIF
jgi:hypothetical protein